jgi:26S proteasome regulatory subunit T6
MGKEEGIKSYYLQKVEEAEVLIREKTENLRRLEAQRNELNSKGNLQ